MEQVQIQILRKPARQKVERPHYDIRLRNDSLSGRNVEFRKWLPIGGYSYRFCRKGEINAMKAMIRQQEPKATFSKLEK